MNIFWLIFDLPTISSNLYPAAPYERIHRKTMEHKLRILHPRPTANFNSQIQKKICEEKLNNISTKEKVIRMLEHWVEKHHQENLNCQAIWITDCLIFVFEHEFSCKKQKKNTNVNTQKEDSIQPSRPRCQPVLHILASIMRRVL